ncbi:cyclopropane mycolic acid synthase family methyltransferase [Mycobacterium hubeiense]|uniref:cyclopropane mycolic acid synthase family methyltransferase n=1 Tax=Mycobacterium hubeiense TaxID=1867256 RepID=UPI000C7F623E|nr:cyclopropane mycolic acid synthase family methyltransferase [Mycobacterium sp. QGD 101]
MPKLKPNYELLQSIYDISNEFYELFLGPTMGYTCGYYEREDMTCSEAQNAKFDLAQGKLKLQPGMRVLDIGCGWGGGMQRLLENYDNIHAIGLTLSKAQKEAAEERLAKVKTNGTFEVRLQGWEEFDEKVDRIYSIGAFEHFRHEKYDAFFQMAYDALPDDGILLLHTISSLHPDEMKARGLPLTFEIARFIKFIVTEIFPGGQLPSRSMIEELAPKPGFKLTRVQSLQPHYVRTLNDWAANLQANKDKAIEIQGQEAYDRFMKYLTGCAGYFASGHLDVCQYTLEK